MLFLFLAVIILALYGVARVLMPEMIKPGSLGPSMSDEPDKKTDLMEALLIEKNRSIRLLETENKVLEVQVRSFGKVKSLLEEEILRLREQNRIFRSELGLPTVQTKENITT
jgi:hypothetical protein